MTSQCFVPLGFYTMSLYYPYKHKLIFKSHPIEITNFKVRFDHTFHPRSAFISPPSKEQ